MTSSFYATVEKDGKVKEICSMAEDHEMVFSRTFMNIYLDQYQTFFNGVSPTYDDITAIAVNDVAIPIITDLPSSLQTLVIMNSTLARMEIPAACQSIRKLHIYKSNLEAIPRLSHVCAQFEYINFSRAKISRFAENDEAWFATPSLREIVLEQNYLTTVPQSLLAFRGGRLLLRNNPFLLESIQNMHTYYRAIHKYKHVPVTISRVNTAQAQGMFANMAAGNENNVLLAAGGQTVHISSVNRSIAKSIDRIVQMSKAAPPLDEEEIRSALSSEWNSMKFIDCPQTHSISHLTYRELLVHVCRVANSLPPDQCADVIVRLKSEIMDGKGMCFTGQMNRLVNSLVGMDIHSDIVVSYSVKEQLQMEMSMLLDAYNGKRKTYEDVVRELHTMFDELTPAVMAEERIPVEYQSAWLTSLRDLHIDSLEYALKQILFYGGDGRAIQTELWPLQIEAWEEELADEEKDEEARVKLNEQIVVNMIKLVELLGQNLREDIGVRRQMFGKVFEHRTVTCRGAVERIFMNLFHKNGAVKTVSEICSSV